jgi:hypothetical protein
MSEPLVVVIPHKIGKAEALRRIRDGLGRFNTEFAAFVTLERADWEGDKLNFCTRSLGQRAHGAIEVYDAAVRLEVTLPWLLAKFAAAAQRVIGQKGQLLLEKKP